MQVQIAFLTVIIIWSTTPLAIQWSVDDVGFLFGSTTRMILGCVFAFGSVLLMGYSVPLHRRALLAYFASGIGIYIAMLFGYWGAMYIPSGWISLIWGLSPVFTGILAHWVLGEKNLVWNRILGALLGIAGLAVIFLHSSAMGGHTFTGVLLLLVGVLGQTGTAVWIKQIQAKVNGLAMTAAGLLVSIPLFVLSWWLFDGRLPEYVSHRTLASIVYLAFFGSVIGFSAYYFLLNHVEASKVSLVTLITPVTALLIGHFLNNESVGVSVILGTALILSGLISYEWGATLKKSLLPKPG